MAPAKKKTMKASSAKKAQLTKVQIEKATERKLKGREKAAARKAARKAQRTAAKAAVGSPSFLSGHRNRLLAWEKKPPSFNYFWLSTTKNDIKDFLVHHMDKLDDETSEKLAEYAANIDDIKTSAWRDLAFSTFETVFPTEKMEKVEGTTATEEPNKMEETDKADKNNKDNKDNKANKDNKDNKADKDDGDNPKIEPEGQVEDKIESDTKKVSFSADVKKPKAAKTSPTVEMEVDSKMNKKTWSFFGNAVKPKGVKTRLMSDGVKTFLTIDDKNKTQKNVVKPSS